MFGGDDHEGRRWYAAARFLMMEGRLSEQLREFLEVLIE